MFQWLPPTQLSWPQKKLTFQKNPPGVLWKKVFLEISQNFTGKHLCESLFFNKVAGLGPSTLFKKSLWHRCFPVNFEKFLKTPFLQNTSGRLFLTFEGSLNLTNLKLGWINHNYCIFKNVFIHFSRLRFFLKSLF